MDDKPLVSVVIPTYNRKEKLIRLINSILQSDYPKDKLEIIVVDDFSTDGTSDEINKIFPEVKLIVNGKKLLLAGSRNVGILNSMGDFIFLIDDDNSVDKHCIFELVSLILSNHRIGVVAPVTYYYTDQKRVRLGGVKRNYITSKTTIIGLNEIDRGQFKNNMFSDDMANAFMVKEEIFKTVGYFDDKVFPIHYDEADFGIRVRRAGYLIIYTPNARVFHDEEPPNKAKDLCRTYNVNSPTRTYYTARNRIIFHKIYSKRWQYLIFILIFNWLFALYYLKVILFGSKKPFRERLKITKIYLKGVLEGVKWKKSC